jgi:hypothetical protein
MKKNIIVLFLVCVLTILIFVNINKVFAISKSNIEDKQDIEFVIEKYFNLRYETRKNNKLQDFSSVCVTDTSSMQAELEKLDLEIYSGIKRNSYYISYKFNLEYLDYEIELLGRSAQITLIENNEIISSIALRIDKENPPKTKNSNIKHNIMLVNSDDGWKITSDVYEDLVWKFIRSSTYSAKELKEIVDKNLNEDQNYELVLTEPTCNLAYDSSSHDYDRNGAVEYAREYAESGNSSYFYYVEVLGGDCTNFVSQCIKEGSDSLMSIPEYTGQGTMGWYYFEYDIYSASWTNVNSFWDFVVHPYAGWPAGPQGCDIENKLDLRKGDVVQYNWITQNEERWDHSIIITDRYDQMGDIIYRYAGHTPDTLDGYLDDIYLYSERRFIRIERINDPEPTIFIPFLIKSSQALTLLEDPATNETTELLSTQAYPAPGIDLLSPTDTPRIGYP